MWKPLEQWQCDSCGNIIEKVADGVLEWIDQDGSVQEFKIVHKRSCSHQIKHYDRKTRELENFVGPKGMPSIVLFFDSREEINPGRSSINKDQDMRELVELIKRLNLAYYEQARIYWTKATNNGFFTGGDTAWMYLPSTLKKLIGKYGPNSSLALS